MNEFIALIETNGELNALKIKWLHSDESKRTFTKSKLSGESGKLIICTDAQSAPFVYLREGQVVGFEAEIIDKFCAAYGYDYEIKIENFLTMLGDITTGKADVGTRKKYALFKANSSRTGCFSNKFRIKRRF